MNNVVYDSHFGTAVNQFLIERGVLDIHQGERSVNYSQHYTEQLICPLPAKRVPTHNVKNE